MRMELRIIGEDTQFKGVVKLQVPSIYPTKGEPLPMRMAKLVLPAAQSLQKVYQEIVKEGGHLYITDMFRSAAEQQKAHEDWKSGRKSSYSPPSCNSVHEAARAIDIDAFDTGIGHKRVREILRKYGWTNIVDTLTGKECWHYEFREAKWEEYHQRYGYPAMARAMKEEIGNVAGIALANKRQDEVQWLQQALNQLMNAGLEVDGIYGESTKAAVMEFQKKYGLQVDGVTGPITKSKLKELLT